MRQLTFISPGQLEWLDVPEPALEGPGEALVRPIAVATCDLDRGLIGGVTPAVEPFAFGHEAVAEVVAVGPNVARFRPGQNVIVPFQISCGECGYCSRGLTANCTAVPALSSYGLGQFGGRWPAGMLSDTVRVPFADAMLVALPDGVEPATVASLGDNISDGYRAVAGPLASMPGADVLIVTGSGAGSIPLYAAGIAVALGAGRVDYADADPRRLEIAAALGANPLPHEGYPRRFGTYPITVDSSSNAAGLQSAIHSTARNGVCSSTSVYWDPQPMPLFEMYSRGITFISARAHARTAMEPALELVASGRFHPELVTTERATWDGAVDALLGYTTKLVITR